MASYLDGMQAYWDKRFQAEGRIWGESPSRTAYYALGLFRRHKVHSVLIPGAGYGRNSKLFSASGFKVAGVEISTVACAQARDFDPLSRFYNGSVLDMSFLTERYNAIYGFNVLHLFREKERKLLIQQCTDRLKDNGLMFFTVFSERESTYGKGKEVETNTFESRPGRPAHYFTGEDLEGHFINMETLETGIMDDPEDHGEGPHTHSLRYICVRIQALR